MTNSGSHRVSNTTRIQIQVSLISPLVEGNVELRVGPKTLGGFAPQGYLALSLTCRIPPLTLLLRNADDLSVQVSGTSRTGYTCYLDYLCDTQHMVV